MSPTNCSRRVNSGKVLLTVAVVGSLFGACGSRTMLTEKAPGVVSGTNVPELKLYEVEFASPVLTQNRVNERSLPFDRSSVHGQIDQIDHHTNYGMWLVLAHTGPSPSDGQKVYYYCEASGGVTRVTAYSRMRVYSASIVSRGSGTEPFILASVLPAGSVWYAAELWTNRISSSTPARLTIGGVYTLAPDRSKVAFWRTDGDGYHGLHVWDVHTGEIGNVVSMREQDPGSGTSWDLRWSADSAAINIRGACSGFQRSSAVGRREFNLVYIVSRKQLFQLP